MPISIETELVPCSQQEFASIAYNVMGEIFSIHKTMGRLFDEKVYKNALTARLDAAQSEVPIHVTFGDFKKTYFLDLLIAKGGIFELKTVNLLNARHRSQLLNDLLLTGLQHGKLVNLRTECVEHEFVNTNLTHADRIKFDVDCSAWNETEGLGHSEKALISDILKDWGTGLDITLYQDAIHHFCNAHEGCVTVRLNGKNISNQTVNQCTPQTALVVTTFEKLSEQYQKNLFRFINSTVLNTIQWINISANTLTYKTIK
ncbi:GxxExxY protein [Pontiellaceae bacterium B12227]|nr:GxxExxY protein [Pontiellaceae bacterium B12227]